MRKGYKKRFWKLTPPFFNDSNQWNSSSWHHLLLQSWWEIPSCHKLPPFKKKKTTTLIFSDRCTWLISSTQKIRFKPWWRTSTWRTVVEMWGDRVLCLQNTSHDLYMWSRQFLSKTWGKQEMRRVQRLKHLQQLRCQGDEWEDLRDVAAFLNVLIYTHGRNKILPMCLRHLITE